MDGVAVTLPQMVPFFNDGDGEAVFRKEIVVPRSEAGKNMILALGALADFDNTYFNGVEVGHTDMKTVEWRQAPRNYVVPGKLVKAGKNVVAVRLPPLRERRHPTVSEPHSEAGQLVDENLVPLSPHVPPCSIN